MPAPLAALVATSRLVTETSSRLGKIRLLAEFLSQVPADELPTAIAFLSGSTPHGRLGVGGAAIREARDVPAAEERTRSRWAAERRSAPSAPRRLMVAG